MAKKALNNLKAMIMASTVKAPTKKKPTAKKTAKAMPIKGNMKGKGC